MDQDRDSKLFDPVGHAAMRPRGRDRSRTLPDDCNMSTMKSYGRLACDKRSRRTELDSPRILVWYIVRNLLLGEERARSGEFLQRECRNLHPSMMRAEYKDILRGEILLGEKNPVVSKPSFASFTSFPGLAGLLNF